MKEETASAPQDRKPCPIFISLENHCSPEGQLRLAAIMREVFGQLLVTEEIHGDGSHCKLSDLDGRILVMVENYGEKKGGDVEEPDSGADITAKGDASKSDKKEAPPKIIPELAALGVYAQSMKPKDNSWTRNELKDPPNHLANLEERAIYESIEKKLSDGVSAHNAEHLMRVYPKGTRISV